MSWEHPDCFPEYDVLVVAADDCRDSSECLKMYEDKTHSGQSDSKKTVSILTENLQSCTNYKAIVRLRSMK